MSVTEDEFELFLNDISDCFLKRDLHAWRRRIFLPFSIVTRDGPVVLRTEKDIKANFEHYLSACDLMSLSAISRRPIALEDCADGTWLGTFETRLLSHGQLATEPYTATALLARSERVLRMSSMLNGRGHHEWTGLRPGD